MNHCDTNSTFKCAQRGSDNYGFCFNVSDILNSQTSITCSNFVRNNSIGYWKATFPSQDYWE